MPWIVAGLVGAAIIIVFGNTNVDHSAGEKGGLGPALITGIGCLVLAAVLFAGILARYNGTRTQVVLAILSVLSLANFWSGAPAVFGAATAAAARRPNGSFPIAGWVGIIAGGLAVIWSVVAHFKKILDGEAPQRPDRARRRLLAADRSLGEGVVVGGLIRHRDGVGDVEFTGASLVPVGSLPRPRDL